jgi:hypothetical protein
MLELGLLKQLLANSTVSALVGKNIFNGTIPRDTLPAVAIQTVSSVDTSDYQGSTGLRTKRLQFDTYANDYFQGLKISDAILTALQGFRGELPDGTFVEAIFFDQDQDFPFEPGYGGYVYRRMVEYLIVFQIGS